MPEKVKCKCNRCASSGMTIDITPDAARFAWQVADFIGEPLPTRGEPQRAPIRYIYSTGDFNSDY